MLDTSDITPLHGQSVLVRSSADHRNPPIALRGTIEARTDEGGRPVVKIVIEHPDMCNRASHQEVIPVSPHELHRLRATEHEGVYEYTIRTELDAET